MLAFSFVIARRVRQLFSLVDREVDFCVPTMKSLSTVGCRARKKPRSRGDLNPRPNRQKATRLPTEPPGRPVQAVFLSNPHSVEGLASSPTKIHNTSTKKGRKQAWKICSEFHPRGFVHLPAYLRFCELDFLIFYSVRGGGPVSYTHLTLPTIYSV